MDMYRKHAHAMQSGVAAMMEIDPSETSPKHLRTGINSAMVDSAALAKLLIAKGIITDEEYINAVTQGMKEEKERYEQRLNARYGGGNRITLG